MDHNLLLAKLDYYDIRGVAKKWFESYLNFLGPLLFLVYINDLHKYVTYPKVYHFADDNNLLQSDNSLKNVPKPMNFDLKNLS